MSSKKSDTAKKNVVLVGGGYANVHVVHGLAKTLDRTRYNLILLNPRPYYVHIVAGLRMVVTDEGKLEDSALIPYDRLPGVTFVQGKVASITETAPGKGGVLTLDNGDQLDYAVLVLGTGSIWSGPVGFGDSDEAVRAHIGEWRKKFTSAKNVVIAGGGAVGIELAGEILDTYPDRKVTIVHSGKKLLNDVYPEKFRDNIERRVRARGIELVDGDYVDVFPEAGTTLDLTTRKGKIIKGVDLVVPAFGARPNTAFVSSLGSDVLTDDGFVKVNPTLEVANHPGVYAVGDILAWREQKQAGKVMGHASVVAANLVSFLEGQPQKKVYKGSVEMILIPIGKTKGAGYFDILWGIQVGDWLSSVIKGKTLLIPMARGKLNY